MSPSINPGKQSSQTSRKRSIRALLVIVALYAWYAVTMFDATPHTTWEHHLYAGPFIMLKESRSMGDFAFCLPWLLLIGVPAAFWIRNGTVASLLLTVAAAAFTSSLSWTLACWASC